MFLDGHPVCPVVIWLCDVCSTFSVSQNQLTGTIPAMAGITSYGATHDFSLNCFSGVAPQIASALAACASSFVL